MLDNFTERRNRLIELQKRLLIKFPVQDYNVYIFGSYIRDDFDPNHSDIDIGILCNDPSKRLDILDFICDTVDELISIKRDIITVDLQPDCLINIDILTTPFQLTDYKPKDLDIYLYKLLKKRREVQYFIQRARDVSKRQISYKY
jgi:predicted nucleotidyltransferase